MKDPDRIIAALANMRQRLMQVGGPYTPDQVSKRLLFIAVMRDFALENNAQGFTDYCQNNLASRPDLTVDILEEFYGELGLDAETCMWDDMAALVL